MARRGGDAGARVALQGLAESYGRRRGSSEDLARALEHFAVLIDADRVRESCRAEGFLLDVLSMGEVLLGKNIVRCAADPQLSHHLDPCLRLLLELTKLDHTTEVFSALLRCWQVVAERLYEAISSGDLETVTAATAAVGRLRGGLLALAEECVHKALFVYSVGDNPVLGNPSGRNEDNHGDGDDSDGEDEAGGDDESALSDSAMYTSKCLKLIAELGQLYASEVRPAALSLAMDTLQNPSLGTGSKLAALQLLADAAVDVDGPHVVSMVEVVAVKCLKDVPVLRCAAYRAMKSMVSSLSAHRELAMSIAQAAAGEVSASVSETPTASASVPAAEFLAELTGKVPMNPPLFTAVVVDGASTAAVPSDRAAAFLAVSAMNVLLKPLAAGEGRGGGGGSATEEEHRTRIESFRGYLVAVLHDFVALCEQGAALSLSAADIHRTRRVVHRGCVVLMRLFSDVRSDRRSVVRDSLWSAWGPFAAGTVSLLARVGVVAEKGHVAAMLLRMLSSMFRACRKHTTSLAQTTIDASFRLVTEAPEGSARDRVSHALLRLVKAELSEIVPGEGDSMIAPAVELSAKYVEEGSDPDLKVTALATLEEGLSRHWRFFFPNDSSESFLHVSQGVPSLSLPASDPTHFNRAMQGILCSFQCPEPEVFSAGLSVLETMSRIRRLYSRSAFQTGGASQATTSALLTALLSHTRTAQQDRILSTLYDIATANPTAFYQVSLPDLLHMQTFLTEQQRITLHASFSTPTDQPTFFTAAEAFANDVAYYHQQRQIQQVV